jgi:Uma2 family endonuclease
MGLAESIPHVSIEEYLAFEEAAQEKHEYLDGVIRAMSGGTFMHSKIKVNLIRELSNRLRGRSCQPYDSDCRISVPDRRSYFYPDASVICGPIETDGKDKNSAINPTVVFEVLSPSTEGFDRKQKLFLYRASRSLRDVVFINYDMPMVEVYHREDSGQWSHSPYAELVMSAQVTSIELELPLASLYEDVEFPPPSGPQLTVVREGDEVYYVG